MQTASRSVTAAIAALFVCSVAGQACAGVAGAVLVSIAPPLAEALVAPPSLETQVAAELADPAPMDDETECMAKAVHHEAANQSLEGQLAVAQLIVTRTQDRRFPKTICGVVNQPHQFVHITRYHPPRDRRWAVAVAISRIAQQGAVEAVAPGALFFHAVYVNPHWGRTHERVARIGAHIFYR